MVASFHSGLPEALITNGEKIYEGDYAVAHSFHESKAVVATGALSDQYYIDLNGKRVDDKEYSTAGDYHEGLAAVTSGLNAYHIDHNGNRAYEENYWEVGDFENGKATAKLLGGSEFYIDKNGNKITE